MPDSLDPTNRDPRLRLGLSSGALYPAIATEDAPPIAVEVGMPELEAMLQTAGEYQPALVRRLAERATAVGCRIHALHVWQELHPLLSPYHRRAAEGRVLFDRAIEAATTLGAAVIVWHGPKREEVASAEGWARFLRVTGALATACGEAGIVLALENVSWCALPGVREVAAFAHRLPEMGAAARIGFAFDPFQAAEAGANPFMVLAAMGDRVVAVHLSDLRHAEPAARHLPPGDGDLPWSALLRAIAGVYAGPLIVEGIVGDDIEALHRVRRRFLPLIAEIEARTASDPCLSSPPAGVIEGIRLFNTGAFYAAHEAIEHEWHAEAGSIRRLYQGILQIGVGFHHALAGNQRGAVLLLTAGIEKTSGFVPACMGLDTGRLVRESLACREQIVALGPDRISAFDTTTIPTIHSAIGTPTALE